MTEPAIKYSDLDLACGVLQAAKQIENAARVARLDAENHVIELMGHKLEGSTTESTDHFKVTTTGKLTRSLDAEAYQAIRSDIPDAITPIDYKPALNLKRLRSLQEANPDIYKLVATCITEKPAKTAVKIEPIN